MTAECQEAKSRSAVLSRNSHWSLVWSNTGLKGWGVEFTLLSLEPYKTSIFREKEQLLLKGTQTADTSQSWHRHTSPKLKGAVSNWTQQHLLSPPTASHHSHVSAISSSTPALGSVLPVQAALSRGSHQPAWILMHINSPALPPGCWQLSNIEISHQQSACGDK